jgi:hypothetical protein
LEVLAEDQDPHPLALLFFLFPFCLIFSCV